MVALLGLSGCKFRGTPDPSLSKRDAEWMALTPQAELDPLFARYVIDDPTREAPGTVVVDTKERQLYFVLPKGKAVR
jgi:lipoprotein-anchoring transpeptidase ErfK/SrfK